MGLLHESGSTGSALWLECVVLGEKRRTGKSENWVQSQRPKGRSIADNQFLCESDCKGGWATKGHKLYLLQGNLMVSSGAGCLPCLFSPHRG